MEESKEVWNSLEITKLAASTLLPLAIFWFGYQTKIALQKHERDTRLSDRIIEKRSELYERIKDGLNNIYCYIEEVGHYKSLDPVKIIEDRRAIHQLMHTQRAYWSHDMFAMYLKYMDEIAFHTWQGVNTDAVIQDDPRQKKSLPSWKNEWENRFRGPRHPEHKMTYEALMDLIGRDLATNVAT